MPHYECFSAEHNLSWRQRRPSLTWTDCFVWIELPLGSAGFQPEPEKRTLGVHRIRLCAEQSTSAELLLWESSRATITLRGSTTNCVSLVVWDDESPTGIIEHVSWCCSFQFCVAELRSHWRGNNSSTARDTRAAASAVLVLAKVRFILQVSGLLLAQLLSVFWSSVRRLFLYFRLLSSIGLFGRISRHRERWSW